MQEAYESVLTYAISQNGPLLKELGIDAATISDGIFLEVKPKNEGDFSHLQLIKEVTLGENLK